MTVQGDQHRALGSALSSNGVPVVAGDAALDRMTDSSACRDDPAALRRHLARDGYVLLREVLDRASVEALRSDYCARLDRCERIDGSAVVRSAGDQGLLSSLAPPFGTKGHPAHDLVRSERFDAFSRDERLLNVAETLLDGPAALLPRRIVRHFDPHSRVASRAHTDYDYLDRGGDQLVTAWIPIGDCSLEAGGLIYLEGSHRLPRSAFEELRPFTDRPTDRRPVSNDLSLTARTLGGSWLWTHYRAGDVVWHSPYMVHASLDNVSSAFRLSADLRFQRRDQLRDERWSDDWSADDGF